jgi:hypothetical protein
MTDKKFALKMVIDGKERDITFEELALSNNLAQEALVGLLIDKKIIKAEDFLNKMQEVKKQRYRSVEDLNKEN